MPPAWPGEELARRLRVSRRTVRRDVDRLRDLGYPVRTAMGADGGYRLAAGSAMPPLPFLTGQRFAARLPEGTDPAQCARDRVYSTAPVFRAGGDGAPAGPAGPGAAAGGEDAADGRLISPPDTVPWLATALLGLGCEFEVHAPPELMMT